MESRLRTMLEEILSGRDSLNESENGDGKGFSKDLVKASWQVLRLSNYGKREEQLRLIEIHKA